MIGAFGQAFRFVGLEAGDDELGFGVVVIGQIDQHAEPRRRDRDIAEQAADFQRPGVHDEAFVGLAAAERAADRNLPGGAGQATGDMDDVIALGKGEGRRGLAGFRDQRMAAVGAGAGVEHSPVQARADRLDIAGSIDRVERNRNARRVGRRRGRRRGSDRRRADERRRRRQRGRKVGRLRPDLRGKAEGRRSQRQRRDKTLA